MTSPTLIHSILNFIPDASGLDIDKAVKSGVSAYAEKHPVLSAFIQNSSSVTDQVKQKVDNSLLDGIQRGLGVDFKTAVKIMADEKISESEVLFGLAKLGSKLPDRLANPSAETLKTMSIVAHSYAAGAAALGMDEVTLAKGLAKFETFAKSDPKFAAIIEGLDMQTAKLKAEGKDPSTFIGETLGKLFDSAKQAIDSGLLNLPGIREPSYGNGIPVPR